MIISYSGAGTFDRPRIIATVLGQRLRRPKTPISKRFDSNGIRYANGNRASRRHVMSFRAPRGQIHLSRDDVRMRLMGHVDTHDHEAPARSGISIWKRVRFFVRRSAWNGAQAMRSFACRILGHDLLVANLNTQPWCLRCRRLI